MLNYQAGQAGHVLTEKQEAHSAIHAQIERDIKSMDYIQGIFGGKGGEFTCLALAKMEKLDVIENITIDGFNPGKNFDIYHSSVAA